MSRMIFCSKLQQELEGLDKAPYPGELGERVYNNISKQAWELWLQHQTMIINEYRLSMIDPKARELLKEEMEKFLFGDGAEVPEGYVPPENN